MTLEKNTTTLSADDKRTLLASLLKAKEKTAASKGYAYPHEYETLKTQVKQLEELAQGSIYFQVSEGVNDSTTRINGKELINFASYNYLGMSGDPYVTKAAKDVIDIYGTSVSASRLASGERPIHTELENEIATILGVEKSIVFVGGYVTNESVIGHMFTQGDMILYDSLIHDSIQQGAALSGATIRPFPHNNWKALDTILSEKRGDYRNVLIVIEGVYSMDGDIPELPEFISVKKKHNAMLMVDEAHSIGVLGEKGFGIGEHFQIESEDVDLWMGTLSKSFASCGGYIAGCSELIDYIKYTTPGFVYSVGMAPSNTASALASIQLLKKQPQRVKELRARANLFLELAKEQGINTGKSMASAVIPVIVGGSVPCVKLYKLLYDRGIYALPIIFPTVPEGSARLRFFVNNTHTEEQIRFTVESISQCLLLL